MIPDAIVIEKELGPEIISSAGALFAEQSKFIISQDVTGHSAV